MNVMLEMEVFHDLKNANVNNFIGRHHLINYLIYGVDL